MQLRFVKALLEQGTEWNHTKAAEIAGYAYPESDGSRLLKKPGIRALMDAQIDEALGASRAYFKSCIIREIISIARANIGDYLTNEGNIDVAQIKKVNPGAVREYRKGKNGEVAVKLQDKSWAIEKLIRLLNLAPEEKDDRALLSGLIADLVREAKKS
jgi:phage terminase small subunit